ncbi:hypothetical protein AQS70_21175 [Pseudomonas endophytica]|uniref:Uncharacterized protein n=2 Tax=Pseudomonas endophytica TaxID=1563157 RepID=A0A0Q0T4P7_9PSED|nr:hypothetical protein AQS70_21175 [Pseudomonas endophytica]
MWGSLLAGEVKSPGSYSLRTLDFLRNISQSEAKLIEKASRLKIQGFIWQEARNQGLISFKELMELQDLGIVSGVDSQSIMFSASGLEDGDSNWLRVLESHSKCIVIRSSDVNASLDFQIYPFTKLGLQIMELGSFQEDEEYILNFGKHVAGKGFNVSIGEVSSSTSEFLTWDNEISITLRR